MSGNKRYFFQFGTNMSSFNYDVTLTLSTSDASQVATLEDTEVTASNGDTTHSNECLIRPKEGAICCDYLVETNASSVAWTQKLNSFSFA